MKLKKILNRPAPRGKMRVRVEILGVGGVLCSSRRDVRGTIRTRDVLLGSGEKRRRIRKEFLKVREEWVPSQHYLFEKMPYGRS